MKVAHVRLCHSRTVFVRAYPRETQETVFDAHDKAFAFFSGVLRNNACGICGADRGDIENADHTAKRVPGQEVVGRIIALGANIPAMWQIGQRVGSARFGGLCLECQACRSGRLGLCRNQPVLGLSCDGGYAKVMMSRATGLVPIPEELVSEKAAPILGAGIATFNGLKASGAEPGDTVAVLGIGGLGHVAVQYARRMEFRVVAIGRGQDIAADAAELGAHAYVGRGAARDSITSSVPPKCCSSRSHASGMCLLERLTCQKTA